ncbi:MAG: putative selenium-dependent hydroxylase accessory protein YqeC [Candidatus Marinimicrobia bacterium]|nr:putative selenium-dependent hydroxylase accessory protein YqeC [Candidatus Neomarinimicrobiota bacterium]
MNFSQILFKSPLDAYKTCIGIIGGGGKTTLLYNLGDELAETYSQVILSSLTKSGISSHHPAHLYKEFEAEDSRAALLKNNPVYVMGEYEHSEKLIGLEEAQLEQLYEASDLTIFECDGARKRPIKAHQPYDPEIPHFATHTIVVVGADAVGAKIDGKLVHRPELFRELWDVNANFVLTPPFIAKVLTSQYGYMKKVPHSSKISYFVNKADTFPRESFKLAQAIARHSNAPVFYGSLEKRQLEKFS